MLQIDVALVLAKGGNGVRGSFNVSQQCTTVLLSANLRTIPALHRMRAVPKPTTQGNLPSAGGALAELATRDKGPEGAASCCKPTYAGKTATVCEQAGVPMDA